jgi:SAM-dependent methyltransferase
MLDLAGLRPGMRVLDLGCGAGEPSLRAAQRVGERGFVFGVDPYAAAVELAREKARIQGIAWVRYEVQGAETLSPQEVLFDAALGRWSLPFMADVRGALSAARALLQPGSPLVLAAWDAAPQIAWWSVPRRVTERFASLPPVNPEAPGASRFARREALLPLAEEVGFALVDEETQQVRVYEAETLPEMESWVWAVFGRWIELVPEESRGEWRDMLHQELSASHEGGRFFLDGVTRLYVLQALGR